MPIYPRHRYLRQPKDIRFTLLASAGSMSQPQLSQVIARELSLAPQQVAGALALFDEGNPLPFIARYRKEATGGLGEVQLRDVRDRAEYLRELADRRVAILKSIEE